MVNHFRKGFSANLNFYSDNEIIDILKSKIEFLNIGGLLHSEEFGNWYKIKKKLTSLTRHDAHLKYADFYDIILERLEFGSPTPSKFKKVSKIF